MASVRHTIISMIREYPDLFQSRTDCLHHLFAVLGNGMEWRNGQLVYKIKYRKKDLFEGRLKMLGYTSVKQAREWLKDHEWERVVSRHANVFANRKEYLSRCYPIGEYSAILSLPNDIKLDWLNAAQEFAGLFMHYMMSTEEPKDPLRDILNKIENRIASIRRKQK